MQGAENIAKRPLYSCVSLQFSRFRRNVLNQIYIEAGAGNFSLHHRVQNGSGGHPASYQMGTRLFPWG
jgi:hypothetical protein